VANLLIRVVLGVRLHDQGCSLKAMRADVATALPLRGQWHRFMNALAELSTAESLEIEVRHHARHAGRSHYGLERTLRVVADLARIAAHARIPGLPWPKAENPVIADQF
jgi:hypothetical protein